MSDKYLNKLIQDPDNLEQKLTIKNYVDLYINIINEQTNKNYTVIECVDYLLEKKQINTINIDLINELCEIYNCNEEELKTHYKEYLQLNETNIQESNNKSYYSESEYSNSENSEFSDTQLDDRTINIDEMSTSEDINENTQLNEKNKLKYDIKQLLGKIHKEKINGINTQIDKLFSNILEKDNGNHNNDINTL